MPLSVPPRGQALWQARRVALTGTKLPELIFAGGVLGRDDLVKEGSHFSVNGLDSIPEERDLLRSAFLTQAPDANPVVFDRLQRTIEWGLSVLEQAPLTPAEMIRQAYARLVDMDEAHAVSAARSR